MAAILTEIAIQSKGALAFLLGLSGMFTIAKNLLIGLLILPKVGSERKSVKDDAARLRLTLILCACASFALLCIAVWLYFGSAMASIDADALKKSHAMLTTPQQQATAALTIVAIVMVGIESVVSVLKYKFDLIAKTV